MVDTFPSFTRRFEFVYDDDSSGVRQQQALTIYVIVALREGRPCWTSCAAKAIGSLESGLLRGIFDLVNAHLGRGGTLTELAPLFRGTKFEPTGMLRIGDKTHIATSPLDAIFAWMIQRFGPGVAEESAR